MTRSRFALRVISRGQGRSAVASAAYQHCARMESEREIRVSNFRVYSGAVHAEFVLPGHAPRWIVDLVEGRTPLQASEAFWNRVEMFEKRKDAQLAKAFMMAVPVELTAEQSVVLVREFVVSEILPRGQVADWVFHDVPGNPHVHLMTNLRPLTEDGFGDKKVPLLDADGGLVRSKDGRIVYRRWAGDKADFLAVMEGWYAIRDKHLELNGHGARRDGDCFVEADAVFGAVVPQGA